VPRVRKGRRKDTASSTTGGWEYREDRNEGIRAKENSKNGNEIDIRSLQVQDLWDGYYRKRPSL
jgi:hypothetical protein